MSPGPEDWSAETQWASSSIGAGSTAPPADQPAPKIDGRYEIVDELGRGAMGAVYRAREVSSGRDVAIKVVLDSAGGSATRLERLRREGELTAQLDHPGIVGVHSAGQVGDRPYVVYALVEGCRSLNDVTPDLSRPERIALLRDVARAAGHAHARGIVHRDIKPGNILIDGDGRALLADFGLATALDVGRLTRTGGMVGTPTHMAPEQIDSKRRDALGPPTDVWALGVTLYWILTGTNPFQGPSLHELMIQITEAVFTRPRAVDPTLPVELEAVCLRALALDPTRRYSDGEALANDLESFLEGRPVQARPPKSTLRWLGLLVALALLVLGALLIASPQDEPPSQEETTGDVVSAPPQPRDEEPAPDPLSAIPDYRQRWAALHQRGPASPQVHHDQRVPLWIFEKKDLFRARFLAGGERAVAVVGKELIVWDLRTGVASAVYITPRTTLLTLAVDPTGRFVASGDLDGWFTIHEVATWKVLRSADLGSIVLDLAFTVDGERIVVGGSFDGVRVYRVRGEGPAQTLGHDRSTQRMALGSGLLATSLGRAGTVRFFSFPANRLLGTARLRAKTTSMRWATQDRLVVGDDGGALGVFDRDGKNLFWFQVPESLDSPLATLSHNGRITDLAIDGDTLYSVSAARQKRFPRPVRNELCIWSLSSRKELFRGLLQTGRYCAVDVHPGRQLLLLSSSDSRTSCRLEVWQLRTLRALGGR